MVDKNAFNYDSLQLFNDTVFADIMTVDTVSMDKKAMKIDDTKRYGYFMKKNKILYFIEDFDAEDESILDVFPIHITKKTETDYNKSVFYFVEDYDSVKIPEDKMMPFKDLIDTIAPFKHSNNDKWVLYKILVVVGWLDRINYRVVGERGFGKDSVINVVDDLIGQVANIYGATFAKLEYSLTNILLIFNEMGNLKPDDKANLQQFLLAIGDFSNKYRKRSRATDDTFETYNLSKQSLGILYNPPMDYVEEGQEWFDTMFTKAVGNRFMPFYFDGYLDEKFEVGFDKEKVVEENDGLYKDCISTLKFYKTNPVGKSPHDPLDDIVFTKKTRRFERSFSRICDYIAEYAEGNEEVYYTLVNSLYESHKRFNEVLADALLKRGNQE